jgi:hypothetical protein
MPRTGRGSYFQKINIHIAAKQIINLALVTPGNQLFQNKSLFCDITDIVL